LRTNTSIKNTVVLASSGVRALRCFGFPLWLAVVRLAHRPERLVLVVCGIATASALLATTYAGSLVASDRSVAARLASLPPDVRAIRLASINTSADEYATLDARARETLEPLLDREPAATVLYRESTIAGSYLGLGAVDGLGPWIHLRSGRLPHACRPEHCEVVQLRGRGGIPNVPGLRLVSVGRGELVSTALFGDGIAPARNGRREAELSEQYRRASRYHLPAPPPLVLAEGVAALIRSPVLLAYRTYGWVVPIESRDVHAWSIDELLREIEQARSTLRSVSSSFDLRAPEGELRAADDASTVAGRRLLLLGGQASALLLAFAVLAATRLRRDSEAARQRLIWLAAPRWSITLALTAEALLLTTFGLASGWLVGVGASALLARREGESITPVLTDSVLSAQGLYVASLLGLLVFVALFTALTVRAIRFGGLSFSPLDFAALAALAFVAIAAARGRADPQALLAERGTGVLLLLLPALIAFVVAVSVARLLPVVLRLVVHASPARRVSLRLAVLALARRPGYAAVTAAFLTVSLGLALFAESYRSTLIHGEDDQAKFAVPADFVLREDLSRLIAVNTVATSERLDSLGPAVSAHEVTRQTGGVRGSFDLNAITVLGLHPAAMRAIDGWRADFANSSLATLAAGIGEPGEVRLRGEALPPRSRSLALPLKAAGRPFSISADLESKDGTFLHLKLGNVRPGRRQVLTSKLPKAARGGRLVALRFDPPPRLVERGSDAGGPAEASVRLWPLRAGVAAHRQVVSDYAGWLGVGGARQVASTPIRLSLTLTNAAVTWFRPRQPTDGHPLPAVVSPRLAGIAGKDGILALDVADHTVPMRIVGLARRFPGATTTLSDDFAVVDRDALVTALNAEEPGAGFVNEVWVDAPAAHVEAVGERLRRPPFDVLELESQRHLRATLQDEPIARASLLVLEVAAAVALVLALVGLVLGIVSELRDERGELFDLETQGVGPRGLRRQVGLRALIVVGFGLSGAAGLAFALSFLVVRFVALTAGATLPEPPLRLALSWTVVSVSLAAVLCLAAILVGGVAAYAFSPATPERESGVGT
jgi:hypothetical protein